MKVIMRLLLLAASVILAATAQAQTQNFNLQVSGDAATAPIYTMEGTATSQFSVDGDLNVNQSLTYSMDSVASGAVNTTGDLTIKRDQDGPTFLYEWRGRQYWWYRSAWDAAFQANSTYGVASFGQLIVVNFNHRLTSPTGQAQIIDDTSCNSAFISSRGRMFLISDSTTDGFEFVGAMGGEVRGFNEFGGTIKRFPYRNVYFEQSITGDFSSPDWGSWVASYAVEQNGRRLAGQGDLYVGVDDPADALEAFDHVEQNLSGSFNARRGIFSWGAAGAETTDRKVTVKITHNSEDQLIDGKNQISAAGQRRRF